jgi:hypothetical protein
MTSLLPLPLLLLLAGPTALPRSQWCSGGEIGQYQLEHVQEMLGDPTAEGRLIRRIYQLSHAANARAELVADEAVCERAARAYYRHVLGPMEWVVVVKVLDRYVVFGSLRAGEFQITTVFTTEFDAVGSVAG